MTEKFVAIHFTGFVEFYLKQSKQRQQRLQRQHRTQIHGLMSTWEKWTLNYNLFAPPPSALHCMAVEDAHRLFNAHMHIVGRLPAHTIPMMTTTMTARPLVSLVVWFCMQQPTFCFTFHIWGLYIWIRNLCTRNIIYLNGLPLSSFCTLCCCFFRLTVRNVSVILTAFNVILMVYIACKWTHTHGAFYTHAHNLVIVCSTFEGNWPPS